MAYAALLSVSNTINLILSHHQDSISPPAQDLIISIAEYVIFLQAFLEDFPNEARRFEAIIKAVTLAAEDIIEVFISSHVYEPRHASVLGNQNLSNSLPDKTQSLEELISKARYRELEGPTLWEGITFTWLVSLAEPSKSEFIEQPKGKYKHLHYDFQELKEAKEEVESIAERVMRFKNSITVTDIPSTTATSSSRVIESSLKDVIVGLDDDLMHIKSLLCRDSSVLEVVSIVGMGGIGKTMLARNVYNDPLIMEYFDICAWVTVSQDYCVPEIVSSLVASMKVFDANSDAMQQRLLVFQTLKSRRFLIVLDDIWSVDVWDDLQLMFPDDGNGSRIMLTTRLQDMASYANTSSLIHKMNFMNTDHSWNLLQHILFKHDPCPVELEKIGKIIARRCRGLPLAVVVIAGILSSVDQTKATWNIIAENVKSTIYTNEAQIDKILSLSYVHLPRHLRTCLLYIAGFPEDYNMRVSKLINLWVAEGFLKPSGTSTSSEETGREYLEDLVKRNLVLVIQRSTDGRIKKLSMHDLIREMCIKKAKQEDFFHRFLCESRKTPLCARANENIRITRYLHDMQLLLLGSLPYYALLRILDLQHLGKYCTRNSDPNLPSEICELFHLRYLAFHCHFRIPAGISNLENLQTFIIYSAWYDNHYVYNANSIPFLMEIWSMPQLRHLQIGIGFFFCLPRFREGESFALENLQTLSLAINLACTRDIVAAIPNVKKLVIRFTSRDDEQDYQLNNLMYLEQLENLRVEIYGDFPCFEKVTPAFPLSLKKLTLRKLQLPWEDMGIVGLLPNLQVLKLKKVAYTGDTWETTEGQFLQLKYLLIDITDLENWITESSHFPRLERLVLYRCPCLNEIPADIGEIPTLELIVVDSLNDSLVESAKIMQENQQDCGNDSLRVRIAKF